MSGFLQLISDYWVFILVFTGLGIASFYVPGIRGAMIAIWAAVNKQEAIIKVIMFLLGLLVRSTKNTLDDEFYDNTAKRLGYHPKKGTKDAL